MLLAIPDVLAADELADLRERLQGAPFVSGTVSAGAASSAGKNNLQADENDPAIAALRQTVTAALERNQMLQFLGLPKHIMPPMFNRYDVGMYYRDHVDYPLLGKSPRVRADLSLTLFLTPPADYDGGELVVETPNGAQAAKLEAGSAILYPAYSIHRVMPVTRGSRLAAITTIQSFIRDETRRDLMADMVKLLRWVQDQAPESEPARLAGKIHANLIRIWADS